MEIIELWMAFQTLHAHGIDLSKPIPTAGKEGSDCSKGLQNILVGDTRRQLSFLTNLCVNRQDRETNLANADRDGSSPGNPIRVSSCREELNTGKDLESIEGSESDVRRTFTENLKDRLEEDRLLDGDTQGELCLQQENKNGKDMTVERRKLVDLSMLEILELQSEINLLYGDGTFDKVAGKEISELMQLVKRGKLQVQESIPCKRIEVERENSMHTTPNRKSFAEIVKNHEPELQ